MKDECEIVASIEIPKTSDEEIHVALKRWNGHAFLDVRQWWMKAEGAWIATRKGCSIPREGIKELWQFLRGLGNDDVWR